MSEIFNAIKRKEFDRVKCIVMNNPNCVHVKDEQKLTPLDCCITYGQLEIAKFLYEKGGRPNLENYRDGEWTPVHWIAQCRYTATLKWVFENKVLPLFVLNVKDDDEWTPLDKAIAFGNLNLETVQYLWEMGGRPNLDIYNRDGKNTPVHEAARIGKTAILKWVFAKSILPLRVLTIKNKYELTPLDVAIYWTLLDATIHFIPFDPIRFGSLELVQFFFEIGGRPNLEIYNRDGESSPVHNGACCGDIATLKWIFTKKVLPLSVLNIKNWDGCTPLDVAISEKKWKTAALLRRLLYVEPVFLVMHRAKRDFHQMCVLRRLPNELLDMVVDEVATRHNLVVVWSSL